MTENHTPEDANNDAKAADASSNAYVRSRTRRQIIVAISLVALAIGIGALVAHAPAFQSAHRAYLATVKYEAGMRALKGDGRTRDMNAAKHLFIDALLNGEARGHYGLACIMYQQGLEGDGLNAAALRLRMEIIFTNLAHAANHGSLPAQAALVSYHPWEDQAESKRLVVNLLKAAANSGMPRVRDPALPDLLPGENVDKDATAYVMRMLQQGLCAPALSDGEANIVISRAVQIPAGPEAP